MTGFLDRVEGWLEGWFARWFRRPVSTSPAKDLDVLEDVGDGNRLDQTNRFQLGVRETPVSMGTREQTADEATQRWRQVPVKAPVGHLSVVAGELTGRVYELWGTAVLGRSSDSDIQIPDPTVSKHHARIRVEGHRCIVEDLRSTNGTFVNGRAIDICELRSGDRVKMGLTELQLTLKGH